MADHGDRHADHDLLLIASLLDGDVDDAERVAAEARIATCGDCAALYADLLALSQATRDVPVASRPRDFRLTAADAERLVAVAPREPKAAISRRTGVMNDRSTTTHATHATHDTLLVAALTDRTVSQAERDVAEAMVAGCRACADLHADLIALRIATIAMPTPVRPRDYTLTADDVIRLRPKGWRRLVAAFGSARDTFSRPLAVGLTTMGIVGLLVASLPSMMTGSATSGSGTLTTVGGAVGAPFQVAASNAEAGNGTALPAAAAAPTPGPSGQKDATAGGIPSAAPPAPGSPLPDGYATMQPDRGLVSPTPSSGEVAVVGEGPSPTPATTRDQAVNGTADEPRIPPLAIVSGLLLLVGLGLFAIRWGVRRFGDG